MDLIDLRNVSDLTGIDINMVDTNTLAPEMEPNRQLYFMAKSREYVKRKSEELGRNLTVHITTFGCQMNAKDSEKLLGILEKIGYEETDDEKAAVGSINLDFRSLYLHFECASYFFRNAVVMDVEEDFQKTLAKSERITLENCRKYPFIRRFAGKALRILAPLM